MVKTWQEIDNTRGYAKEKSVRHAHRNNLTVISGNSGVAQVQRKEREPVFKNPTLKATFALAMTQPHAFSSCANVWYLLRSSLWSGKSAVNFVRYGWRCQSRKSEGCRWCWYVTVSRDVKSLVLLNIWFKDVKYLHMLYILGEFQALPINLRFPSQKLLTVSFSERETALRTDEQKKVLVKTGHRRRVLPGNVSLPWGTSPALHWCNPEGP